MANYYNIDDILAEEEFVPVVFHKAANGVVIDPSSETNSVEQGAKVELPLWLAQELYLRQAISISVPACFSQRTRLEIQADAACVDLKSRSPYFYEFGCKIAPLVGDKTIEILLLSAFKIRYKEILTKAYTAVFTTTSKFLTLLTKEETNLYEAAQASMAAFKKWRMGGPRLQRASVLGRKRKPLD
ncbi:hypothetical protein V6N13_062729 [Hibiscus sabdariffa]|uniref:GINS subunit domain-containing protein n=2 Tax=Hibiscus sabdariffa TaxID=183260 RepID=A0ABR2B2L2_9ROSI